ncbi:MAG: hypothetical protein WDA16_11760 [Candidatus Thermoplasmatota archaeon]
MTSRSTTLGRGLEQVAKKTKKKQAGYVPLRGHAARIIKLAEYPMHVNGGYLDDPERIPMLDSRSPNKREG